MCWSGIPLFSIPKGMEQPGREEQCLSWGRTTHYGDAFCLPTAPAAPNAFSLVTGSPVPYCRVTVPALLGAPVCSMALAKLLPPSFLLGDFI